MEKIVLSQEPLVYYIDGILDKEECQHMIDISSEKLQQALVSGETSGYKSSGRTGKNCWIPHNTDEMSLNIASKIANLVDRPLENAESFQVIHYAKDQKYEYHLDAFPLSTSEKSKRCMRDGGQRMLTALIYLNDVEEGGETGFKNLKVEVKPKMGRIVVFEDTKKDSLEPHPDSLHSGRPVIKGEKYAVNLWFRHLPRREKFDIVKYLDMKRGIKVEKHVIDSKINSEISKMNYLINENFLKDSEIKSLLLEYSKIKHIKENNREVGWISNNLIYKKITKLEKEFDIPQQYFEKCKIVSLKKGTGINLHYDSFDVTKPRKCLTESGNRIFTIIGNLSDTICKFSFKETILNLRKNGLLIYQNCELNNNSNNSQRYSNLNYSISNVDVDCKLFFVFIREKYLKKYIRPKINLGNLIMTKNINELIIEDYNKDLLNFYKKYNEYKILDKKLINFKSEGIKSEESILKIISNSNGLLNRELLNEEYIFDEYHPITLNKVLKEEFFKEIQNYYHEGINNKNFVLGDRQSNRFKSLNEVVSRLIQYEILDLIKHITKKNLKPTYTYLSAYTKDSDLPPHTDREDCEFTVSFLIDKPDNTNFPIYVDLEKQPIKYRGRYNYYPNKENCVKIDCDPNGLMMFSGVDHIHFRDKLNTEYFITLLLHFRSI